MAAHVTQCAAAAVAAADGPSFDAVTRFVLQAAAAAPRPEAEGGEGGGLSTTTKTLPPLAPRLPAALAVAGGVNPVDHVAAVRRLAAGLTIAGCHVALLAPADVEGRGGLARALNSSLRQLAAPTTDADDVTALVTWYADIAFEAEGDAAAAAVAVRAAVASGRSARSTARSAVAATLDTSTTAHRLVAPAGRPPLVFVIESVEACDPHVLGDLLRTLRFAHAAERLPVVAVLGVATSSLFATERLPPSAVRAMDIATFRLARTARRADAALAAAFAGAHFPGALPDAATAAAVDDRFTHVDFTAAGLGRALDAHIAEHARAALLAPFGAALARVGPFDTCVDAARAAPPIVRAALIDALSLDIAPSSHAFSMTTAAALNALHAAWSLWATGLRALHVAATSLGFAGAGDGYSMRELVRDAADPAWWAKDGQAAVAAVVARVRAGGARAARGVCAALAEAAAAVDGGEEAVCGELEEAQGIVEGGVEEEGGGDDNTHAPAAASLPTTLPPTKRTKSAAGRLTMLATGARDAAAAAAAATAARAHPAAAAAAALLTRVAARALASPPTSRPDAAPIRVVYNGAVARSLTGAPRAAVHRALTDPDRYLGLRASAASKTDASLPPAVACGDDDAVLLYRILLQCDETNDARELLARFAALHGYAPAPGDDPAVAPAAAPAARRRKKGGGGGVGDRGATTRAASPLLGPRAPPAPAVPAAPLPGATPVPEVVARFQRALAELQMVGAVGRARRRGQVRRAMFPPGV